MKKLGVFFIISFSVTHSVENICNIFINVRAEDLFPKEEKMGEFLATRKVRC